MSFPEVGVPAQDHYWKSHELLTAKYPNLANPDFKLWAKPAQFASPPRIACFEFHADSMTSEAPLKTVFNGLEELKAYLSQTPAASLIFSPTRRIFVMEGLQPSYIAELGRELKVDPRVCFRHQRFALWESTVPTAGNSLRLPSVIAEEGSFCMDYCQLMHLNTVSQDFTSRCAENERHIASSRQGRSEGRKFDGIGIAHRKASFWSRKLDNGGWTGNRLRTTEGLTNNQQLYSLSTNSSSVLWLQGALAGLLQSRLMHLNPSKAAIKTLSRLIHWRRQWILAVHREHQCLTTFVTISSTTVVPCNCRSILTLAQPSS